MNAIFIYKKGEELYFLNMEDAFKKEAELIKQGFEHISTIDPAIILKKIHDILQESYSSDEKICDIISLLDSE